MSLVADSHDYRRSGGGLAGDSKNFVNFLNQIHFWKTILS